MLSASDHKQWVAWTSVLAAIVLTLVKIIVGFSTQSLGILAEAAHSGLDLMAAIVTLLAVRWSDRPADVEHPYGHGKIENLSALFETLLLLITCVWISMEAVRRLTVHAVEVEPTVWAFAVMILSIIVDISRSRALMKAAKKYNSQALEADALHFSTDIWSSAVVILGLTAVRLGQVWPEHAAWLGKADAVAALGVAVIVVMVSLRLGRRTLQGLLDTAPTGLADQIKPIVEGVEGVVDCHHIRVRTSGPHLFVDVHVLIDGTKTLNEAHALTERIEERIQQLAPNADVTVHPEPVNMA
ncbi:MAG: cation diffusion facilitator family transporter [Phycisphaerae bacterium]|nr:cation diffusion facilitator family transporter [Phycisphaerae bacterium]